MVWTHWIQYNDDLHREVLFN